MIGRNLISKGLLLLSAVVVLGRPAWAEAEKVEETPYTVTETEIKLPGITIDRKTLEVRIEAVACLESGILEFVVCRPNTFEHESIFTTEAKPELVHAALLLAGLKPTPQLPGLDEIWWEKALKNPESRVKIEVEWEQEKTMKRVSLTSMMRNREVGEGAPVEGVPTKKKAAEDGWVFAGSYMRESEETGERVYGGNISGILVGIWPDLSTVIQYGIASGNPYEGKHQGLEIEEKNVPKLGTKVTLIFSRHASLSEKKAQGNGEAGESEVEE